MLAGLDQQRVLGGLGIAEAAVVAHAHAGGVAGIGNDVDRGADLLGRLDALGQRSRQHQGHAQPMVVVSATAERWRLKTQKMPRKFFRGGFSNTAGNGNYLGIFKSPTGGGADIVQRQTGVIHQQDWLAR